MSDRYAELVRNPLGARIASTAGLPQPELLSRWKEGAPAIAGPVLVTTGLPEGSGAKPIAAGPAAKIIADADADVQIVQGDLAADAARQATGRQTFTLFGASSTKIGGIVVDATGITNSGELEALYNALHETATKVRPSGRIVVIGRDPETVKEPSEHIAQRSLEGFTRSLGKETGRGRTVNLVLLAPGGEDALGSTLHFLLSARSAYVSGQVIHVGKAAKNSDPADWSKPLAGKVALVTGASRGIGAAIAEVLHRDGAEIIGLDIPPLADELAATLRPLGGEPITLDVTADDAPAEFAAQIKALHGRVDIVVHNAGITQDRRLARMKPERWQKVLAVNLQAPQRLTDGLIEAGLLGKGSRIIGVSSIAGVAGNNGQTNYGTSKAGIIGFVEAYGEILGKLGGTANAVAPGFIETKMTAEIPLTIREAGRRMNSMTQGGLPVDVAETIAWLASPGSAGVNGRTVRVCGQSLIGA